MAFQICGAAKLKAQRPTDTVDGLQSIK